MRPTTIGKEKEMDWISNENNLYQLDGDGDGDDDLNKIINGMN